MTSDYPRSPDQSGRSEPDQDKPGPDQDKPEAEKEWWDDPAMPWAHKPTRADITCFTWIGLYSLYLLIMLPLRPLLIPRPFVYAALAGSYTAVVTIGAVAAPPTSTPWWWLGLLLATLSAVKFDWVYFWAGRLWGHNIIEMIAGKSERNRRGAARAQKVVTRFSWLAIFVTYLPLPIPGPVVQAALAANGMGWKKFYAIDIASALIVLSAYMFLGYRIGEVAVVVVKEYAKYAMYVTFAILGAMLVGWWWKKRRQPAA